MRVGMQPELRTQVAVYRRTVRASAERIWENVLDWEHLPWLHRASFTSIRLLEASRDGWRAVVGLPSSRGPRHATVEVELDRPNRRYFTRTIEGAGEGTEITTWLEPEGEDASRISVEFDVPDVEPERAPELGAAYTQLYTRLWSEDEAMMIRRAKILRHEDGLVLLERRSRPRAMPPVLLGPASALRERLPLVVRAHGRPFRIVEIDGRLHAHSTVCPHRGGPLDEAPVEDSCIRCPWHGYLFQVPTGRSLDHPGVRLEPRPGVFVDPRTGEASLVFPRPS